MGIRHKNLADQMQGVANTTDERGPSKSFWLDCPFTEFGKLGQAGIVFETDYTDRLGGALSDLNGYTGTTTTEVTDWIQTEVTSGQTLRVEAGNTGILRVSSEAHASANDGLTVMYRATPFVPTSNKKIWFEARVRFTGLDNTQDAEDMFAIGLCNTVNDLIPSGVIDDTVDKAMFYHEDGDTTSNLGFITAKTTVQEETKNVITGLVDLAWHNLGIKCEWYVNAAGTNVAHWTGWYDGVKVVTHNTATEVPTAGTGLGIAYAAISEGTTDGLLDVDWVRVAAEN